MCVLFKRVSDKSVVSSSVIEERLKNANLSDIKHGQF